MRMHLSVFVAIFSVATAAEVKAQDRAGMRITVTVPESCYMQADDVQIAPEGGLVTATVTEMCNSMRGFRVTASHRPLGSDEQVRVVYAGNAVTLASSGISDIAFRQGPTFGRVAVSVNASELHQGLAISFGMTAI